MNRIFWGRLLQELECGNSVQLLTVLAGQQGSRDITSQKLLRTTEGDFPSDPSLAEFWGRIPFGEMDFPTLWKWGGVEFFCEKLSAHPQLILCGGGHISLPLAQIASLLDFEVTVLDDRPEFANSQRFPQAYRTICAPFDQALEQVPHTDSSYFVVVTRGHQYDRTCLERILQRPFAYLGMIGSRKKVQMVMEELRQLGFPEDQLGRVHAPIGLPIGGQTPGEIAVSIAAQLVQIRHGASQGSLDLEGLRHLIQGEPMVLATILEKQGSAPRGPGAKMLISPSGELYGTIGGGSCEAATVALAPEVLSTGHAQVRTFRMDGSSPQDAGMICGGTVRVLLDPLK